MQTVYAKQMQPGQNNGVGASEKRIPDSLVVVENQTRTITEMIILSPRET